MDLVEISMDLEEIRPNLIMIWPDLNEISAYLKEIRPNFDEILTDLFEFRLDLERSDKKH